MTTDTPNSCFVHNINVTAMPSDGVAKCTCPTVVTVPLPDLTKVSVNNRVYATNLEPGQKVPLTYVAPNIEGLRCVVPRETTIGEVEILSGNRAKITRATNLWGDFWAMLLTKTFVITPVFYNKNIETVNKVEIVDDSKLACYYLVGKEFDAYADQNYIEGDTSDKRTTTDTQ